MNRMLKRALKKIAEKTAVYLLIYVVMCLFGFTIISILSWIVEVFTQRSALDEFLQIEII